MPSDYELEMILLSCFARVARDGVDRSPNRVVDVDPATGLPRSANDLAGRAQAICGEALAMQLLLVPDQLAAGLARRPDPEDDTHLVSLCTLPRDSWTDAEAEYVAVLTRRLKVAAHRLNEREGAIFVLAPEGWQHPEAQGAQSVGLGDDGLTRALQITGPGLAYALRRTKGTKWHWGSRRIKDDVSRQVWREAPQWAREEYR